MARVYVGTYKKYNEGSLKGDWLDLADYETYDDFLKACKRLHKGESDPEFMIQDSEDFPDGLDCMEWISRDAFNDIKLAMKEEAQAQAGKPAINIIDYSEKAFAVVGDTKVVKDQLKKMGGRFNGKLSCGAGWIFSNKMRKAVEEFIASGEVSAAVNAERKANTPAEGKQFTDWLAEYVEAHSKLDYKVKHSVGAIKMQGGFYFIEKPSISNRFCFADEGPDYDLYCELIEDDKKMAAYFKKSNLAEFDRYIKRITNTEQYADTRVWWRKWTNEISLCFYSNGVDKNYTLCTDEEKALILKGLQFGRELFEKRLDAYLKRYGVSKLHTWTYWRDA